MTNIYVFSDAESLAIAFAEDFASWIQSLPPEQTQITVALSGGSTPQRLFQRWAENQETGIDWKRIHLFWGDERCVAPEDDESNYGTARRIFLENLKIDPGNIHRIRGEDTPESERDRYETEIQEYLISNEHETPMFDLIILGMGEDGHTASIFPHQSQFLTSERICEIATHPQTGQQRITLTGRVLNAAKRVVFLITGENKADVLGQVINQDGEASRYPVAHITSAAIDFYLDEAAAKRLTTELQ